jgi:hypothetical protein
VELGRRKIELTNQIEALRKKRDILLGRLSGQENETSEQPTMQDISVEFYNDFNSRMTQMIVRLSRPGWIIKGLVISNELLFKDNGGHCVRILGQSI